MKKEILRKEYKNIRDNIELKKEKSNIITEKIKELEVYKKANVIAVYKSFSSEVDTSKLIEYSISIGKIICLPRIQDNKMEFFKINKNSNYIKNKFGIDEPIDSNESLIEKEIIDLLVVPGLCFDMEKNRLGFGKGYYDKFLENMNVNKIGICFNEQLMKNNVLPCDNYDIKMDYIITDTKIIK